MGVWIETTYKDNPYLSKEVTPYVGVWIETTDREGNVIRYTVTPYVGVWIETTSPSVRTVTRTSLLMWECGLKPRLGLVR